MAMNRAYIGHEFAAPEPFEVTRGKIREFADAIDDPTPAYRSAAAARELGYRDVVAPPTFPIVLTGIATDSPIFDPEFGMDYSRVLHGEQKFSHRRSITAGDVLNVTGRIATIRDAGRHELVHIESELRGTDSELVCTTVHVLMSVGTAAGEGGQAS